MKISIVFFYFFLLFFILLPQSFAVAPSIITSPSSIIVDTPFTVSATMSGLSANAIYHLRLAFALPGSSNYFGSTFNGTNFYNGTPSPINYANFYSITTDSAGGWFGNIQGQVESSDPNFTKGNGSYDLKIGRYTQNGTTATWSKPPVAITVVGASSIPSPSPSPTKTPTKKSPAKSPTKAPATPAPTQKISSSIPSSEQVLSTAISPKINIPTSVLGQSTKSAAATSSSKVNNTKKEVKVLGNNQNNIFKILIGVGGLFVITCAILLFRYFKNKESNGE